MTDPRLTTEPLPRARRQQGLVHDVDAMIDAAALDLLRQWSVPQPASQEAYDLAVTEARSRLSAGARPHRSNEPGTREPTHVASLVETARNSDIADGADEEGVRLHMLAEAKLGANYTADQYAAAVEEVARLMPNVIAEATDDDRPDRLARSLAISSHTHNVAADRLGLGELDSEDDYLFELLRAEKEINATLDTYDNL